MAAEASHSASAASGSNRAGWFWLGCAVISLGVLLHVPMLVEAHAMGNRLVGMPVDTPMLAGMAMIAVGAIMACWGALPGRVAVRDQHDMVLFAVRDGTPLNRWHATAMAVLAVGLIIDVMKPATLGFVLPGLAKEYGIERSTAALLPLVALTGTAVGSIVWGWIADAYGRRVSILLSAILFAATSICGAMPSFGWNLLMCFLMGSSAGGMLPVVYTLLAEIIPPRHRSWVLVLVGGTGLVGGYLAASGAAHLLEPGYGWRSLWLQGFPTGLALLVLARFIPESPAFLLAQGRSNDLSRLADRFGFEQVERIAMPQVDSGQAGNRGFEAALVVTALSWSFVNFGLLLWLPMDLQARGYSSGLVSGVLASSALLALPTTALAAWCYSRLSSKWTLIGTVVLTMIGLVGALLPTELLVWRPLLIGVVTILIVGTNGTIAVLLPYTAESFAVGVRGRATGVVAGCSKFGGIAVQVAAIAKLFPTLGGAALALLAPTILGIVMLGLAGRETRTGAHG
ncbi:MFS transporter [Novosphingobium sp.]|uniref:MFS transporter n=1 Tax=Novosphingobium sp. TaxID=1874826 RepID=UPI0025D0280F|nr:MFS transporter [Novosphingobium sp.]